jgi:hypothetical protein
MPSVYDPDNFAGRVNHACAVILSGRRTNRTFDTCFEMYDGAAVAAAVYQRAEKNPRMMEALPRYLCVVSAKKAAEDYKGRRMADVAEALRAYAYAQNHAE